MYLHNLICFFQIGLQARLHQLEQNTIDLRSDQLRQELACDSARSAKYGAQQTIDERERQIATLHEDLARNDQVIERQRSQIEQLMEALAGRENTEVWLLKCLSLNVANLSCFSLTKSEKHRICIKGAGRKSC